MALKLNANRRDQMAIKKLFEGGYSPAEIAQRTRVSIECVYRFAPKTEAAPKKSRKAKVEAEVTVDEPVE